MKTLYMETTKIPVGQTVAEIQRILGEYGACAVMTEYKDGEVMAVVFKVKFLDRDIPFRLPCRWQAIDKVMRQRVKKAHKGTMERITEQSKMVAWRQILRWVEAQMALVETDMVKVHEIFLPYLQVSIKGETLSDRFETSGLKMLENKS
jgi:hypothetical protein